MSKLVTFAFKHRNGIVTFEPEGQKKFMVKAIDGFAKVTEEQAAFMKQHHLFLKVYWQTQDRAAVAPPPPVVVEKPTPLLQGAELSNKLRETAEAQTGMIDVRERIRQQAEEGKKLMDAQVAADVEAQPEPHVKNPNRVAAMKRAQEAQAAKRAAKKLAEGVSS